MLSIYAAITAILIVATVIRSFVFSRLSTNASKVLHEGMVQSILKASMSFYNENSAGRILNRFARDLGIVDQIIPITMMVGYQLCLVALGSVVVIAVLDVWLLLPLVVLSLVGVCLRLLYVKTSLSLKHLEGASKC